MNNIPFESKEVQDWFLNILRNTEAFITFKKVDGTERIMYGTLKTESLPKAEPSDEPKAPRKESVTAFRLFDIDKNEFRSIRWDSIVKLEFSV